MKKITVGVKVYQKNCQLHLVVVYLAINYEINSNKRKISDKSLVLISLHLHVEFFIDYLTEILH